MKRYYFISGLPRSGSTLLSAILKQNPKVHADTVTNLQNIFDGVMGNYQLHHNNMTYEQSKNVFKRLIQGYYEHLNEEIIFDSGRDWTNKLGPLMQVLPETKLICCMRDIPSILNSLEYYYSCKRISVSSNCVNGYKTIHARIHDSFKDLVEAQYYNCKFIFFSKELRKNVLFVDYDELISNTKNIIENIYKFIGEDTYEHYFDNISFSKEEFDISNGIEGLHTVKTKVEKTETKWLLPNDFVDEYNLDTFWRTK